MSTSVATGIPIEFRTLSFHSATTKDKFKEAATQEKSSSHKPWKNLWRSAPSKPSPEEVSGFDKLDHHISDVGKLLSDLSTSTNGLGTQDAASRLARDGKNTLPRKKPGYLKKFLQYIFGGFCSVLWIGVIIFFICWRPLGDPDPQAYNLGLAILVLIVIFLQACFSAFQDWSTGKTM